jgi:hypothetical protein
VSTIRPTHLPPQPQGQPASGAMNDAKAAAQRAFFQAALGGTAKPAQTPAQTTVSAHAAAPPPTVFAQPVQRMPDPAAEQPQKILRPGSLLDIRV